MQNEQSSDATQGFFKSIKEFIATIEESENIEIKVNGILSLFTSIIEHSEANSNVSYQQNVLLHSINKSLQATVKVANEFDERIATLEKNLTDLALNTSKLTNGVVKLTEIVKKIPAIDIDNLIKTINEHAEEINENTASIKVIKDKLTN